MRDGQALARRVRGEDRHIPPVLRQPVEPAPPALRPDVQKELDDLIGGPGPGGRRARDLPFGGGLFFRRHGFPAPEASREIVAETGGYAR